MSGIPERLGRLEERMETVEEGVANFKLFQKDMREFTTEFKANERNKEKTDKRRAKVHYFLLTLLSGLIVALFTYMLMHYDGKHISLNIEDQTQRKELSGDVDKRYTADKQPQDAKIPPMR